MTVLDFSTVCIKHFRQTKPFIFEEGMGALKITDDGIRVEGRSDFARSVRFSELSAPNVREKCFRNDTVKRVFSG